MRLGESIKSKREALGLTQQELAEKLFVSRQTVSRWESGTRCPDLIMSKKIALTLGISLDELIPDHDLSGYETAPESAPDISCVKVMLSGIMLAVVAAFLIAADNSNMELSMLCLFVGLVMFVVGLCIPYGSKPAPVLSEELPQKKCPKCGKAHDFDYPKCPFCDFSYFGAEH